MDTTARGFCIHGDNSRPRLHLAMHPRPLRRLLSMQKPPPQHLRTRNTDLSLSRIPSLHGLMAAPLLLARFGTLFETSFLFAGIALFSLPQRFLPELFSLLSQGCLRFRAHGRPLSSPCCLALTAFWVCCQRLGSRKLYTAKREGLPFFNHKMQNLFI